MTEAAVDAVAPHPVAAAGGRELEWRNGRAPLEVAVRGDGARYLRPKTADSSSPDTSGIRPPHGPAQVVWTVLTVTKGGFNQKFERFPGYPSPWSDRDPDVRLHKIVDDAIRHVRIPALVLYPSIDMRP